MSSPHHDDNIKDDVKLANHNDTTDNTTEEKKASGRYSKISRSDRWEEMFRRLVKFRDKHGHCIVPNRYLEDRQLGTWVSTQRRHYKALINGTSKSLSMTAKRAQRLAQIEFDWDAKDRSADIRWETQFTKLLEYVVENGHPLVPIGWSKDMQLANWVSTQRQEYKAHKKGGPSSLTFERIKLLNSVGFVWEAPLSGLGELRKAFGKSLANKDSLSGVQLTAVRLLEETKNDISATSITIKSKPESSDDSLLMHHRRRAIEAAGKGNQIGASAAEEESKKIMENMISALKSQSTPEKLYTARNNSSDNNNNIHLLQQLGVVVPSAAQTAASSIVPPAAHHMLPPSVNLQPLLMMPTTQAIDGGYLPHQLIYQTVVPQLPLYVQHHHHPATYSTPNNIVQLSSNHHNNNTAAVYSTPNNILQLSSNHHNNNTIAAAAARTMAFLSNNNNNISNHTTLQQQLSSNQEAASALFSNNNQAAAAAAIMYAQIQQQQQQQQINEVKEILKKRAQDETVESFSEYIQRSEAEKRRKYS